MDHATAQEARQCVYVAQGQEGDKDLETGMGDGDSGVPACKDYGV